MARKIQTSVEVKDNASRKVKQFADNVDKSMKDVEQSAKKSSVGMTASLKRTAMAFATVTGAIAAVNKAWETINLAAKAQQQEVAFRNLAASHGANADAILKALTKASKGTVSQMELVEKAGTAMMMGIDPEKVASLMEIARATSQLTGQTITQAFGDISLAVGRSSKMILDNLGIIVDTNKANEEYATSIGKTVKQLTDQEKKQAFLNATIKEGTELTKRLGAQTKTTAEWFQTWGAFVENLKVSIGIGLMSVIRHFVAGLSIMGKAMAEQMHFVTELMITFLSYMQRLPGTAKYVDPVLEKMINLSSKLEMAALDAEKLKVEMWEMGKAPPPVVHRVIPGIVTPTPTGPTEAEVKLRKRLANQWAREKRQIEIDILKMSGENLQAELEMIEDWYNEKKTLAESNKADIEEIDKLYFLKRAEAYAKDAEIHGSIEMDMAQGMIDANKRAQDIINEQNKEAAEKRKRIAEEEAEKRKQLAMDVGNIFKDNITTAFTAMVDGSKKAGEAFKEMAAGILKDISAMIIEMLVLQAIQAAMGWAGTAIGGKAGAAISAAGAALGSANGNVLEGGFQAFANGGIVRKPTLGLIGEGKHNEAVVPLPDGRKIPVDMKGDGGMNITQNFVYNAPQGGQAASEEDKRRFMSDISRQMKSQMIQIIASERRPGGVLNTQQRGIY